MPSLGDFIHVVAGHERVQIIFGNRVVTSCNFADGDINASASAPLSITRKRTATK